MRQHTKRVCQPKCGPWGQQNTDGHGTAYDGLSVVGGNVVGCALGSLVGEAVGSLVGVGVGTTVGSSVGVIVGC